MSRRGGGRGKPSHKGRRRHFTDAEELKVQMEREQRQKEWRENRGEIESDEVADAAGAAKESSDEETSSEDEEVTKPKGVSGLIQVENPNRVAAKMKKVQDLNVERDEVQLSRREREELARQRAKQREIKLQLEGKTDQAKADLARLALIRKEREEAAKKREDQKKSKEEAGRGRGGKR